MKALKNLSLAAVVAVAVSSGAILINESDPSQLVAAVGGGFDQFGYNEKARIFNAKADGVDRVLDGKVWGDTTYANDKLLMKWNAAWDACNEAGNNNEAACAGAWINNEWNGLSGGSGETWHYKIIWVGSQGQNSPYWKEGGYSVWGNYEVLMDQGVTRDDGPMHVWYAKSKPNGYGAK